MSEDETNLSKIDDKSNKGKSKGKPKGSQRRTKGGTSANSLFANGTFSSISIEHGALKVTHRLPSDPRVKLEEVIPLGSVSIDPQVIALVKALNQMLRPGFDPNRKVPIRKDGKVQLDENGKPEFNPSVAEILNSRLKDPSWLEKANDDKPVNKTGDGLIGPAG